MNETKQFEIKETNKENVRMFVEYIDDANAEIRRLQGEKLLHQSEIKLFQNATSQHCKEIAKLKQQLEDAPTWGEWVDATVENLQKESVGFYQLKPAEHETRQIKKAEAFRVSGNQFHVSVVYEDGNGWRTCCGVDEIISDFSAFCKLQYEPKPAREVEKKYGDATAKELSMNPHLAKEWSDLAFDLVVLQEKHAAVQAELRELKGER